MNMYYLQSDVTKVLILPHVVEGEESAVLKSVVLPDQFWSLGTKLHHLRVQVFLGRVRNVTHSVVAVHRRH